MSKTALVTGASSGIGYEFARVLAENGYDLVIVARREEKLNQLKQICEKKEKTKIKVVVKDLSKSNAPWEIYELLNKEGIRVDVLINNAGFGCYGFYKDTDWDRERRMIQVNITSLCNLTKLFIKGMLGRGSGRIVNVASTAAFQPGPLMSIYFATKSFVLSFSEALANEVKHTGVTVTALCPGPTQSEFQEVAGIGDLRIFSIKRMPTSEDVARFGYKAMIKGKTVAIYGTLNKSIAFATKFAPRKMLVSAVRKFQERVH